MTPKIVALVPARGGSKGVPGKNVRPVGGRPLLVHTVEQARATPGIDRVYISTDDALIAATAKESGAGVIARPAVISGDESVSELALAHALDYLQASEGYVPDLVVFLQCTSPIRQMDDIQNAVKTLREQDADSLVSVVASHAFLWKRGPDGGIPLNYDPRHRPRRQDREPEFRENGSIYVFKPWVLREFGSRLGGKIALYEMDEWSGVDIDSAGDFDLCEWLLARKATAVREPLEKSNR